MYLKGPPNLVLCVSKKIMTIRHTNKKILTKNRKKTFLLTSFGTAVVFLTCTLSVRFLIKSVKSNRTLKVHFQVSPLKIF
eukprot:UN21119